MRYVSCAYPHIYRNGATPQGLTEAECVALSATDASQFGIRFHAEIYPAAQYNWVRRERSFVQSSAFTDTVQAFYQHLAPHRCAASALVSIDDAIVGNSVIYCEGEGTRAIIYETYRPNDRPAVGLLQPSDLADAKNVSGAPSNTHFVFLGSAGSSNYGHWLVDDLPRLKAIEYFLLQSVKSHVTIILVAIDEKMDKIRTDTICLLYGDRVKTLFISGSAAVRFERLFYVSPVSLHPISKTPEAMRFVAKLARFVSRPEKATRKIFVSRGYSASRQIANEKPLVEALIARGFTTVDPQKMTAAEQVATFSDAHLVVGIMGAAMTNTIFCRPATPIYYLAPEGWIEPFYYDLAQTRGHDYAVLYGLNLEPDVPSHEAHFLPSMKPLLDAIDRAHQHCDD